LTEAHRPQNQLPEQDANAARTFLQTWLPNLARKEFAGSMAGWTLSTFDSTWIMGPHPSSPSSLYIATGGNDFTFKHIVNVGKYVRESIEGTLHPNMVAAFSWRPEKVASYGRPAPLLDIDQTRLVNDGEFEIDSFDGLGFLNPSNWFPRQVGVGDDAPSRDAAPTS
jgi:hypothetical protein